MVGRLILYNGKPAVIVKTGEELSAHFDQEIEDHLGLWFGEVTPEAEAIVNIVPAEYVKPEPARLSYRH